MDRAIIREIGVPVRAVNRAHLYAGHNKDGRPCVYATMSQQAKNFFVLQINPQTGTCRQFSVEPAESNYTTAVLMSRTGRLYIGAAHSGRLFCFDPVVDGLLDLGEIHAGAAIFPCRIDEDSQGRLWIGSYGTADLTCYDPATATFERLGRMDDTDMYCYPLVNSDDTIASLIMMTRPHVVVFDPTTGKKTVVGPVAEKGKDTLGMHRGEDGCLYIESSLGDYRIDGTVAVPIEKAVPAPTTRVVLADGSVCRFADADTDINQTLEVSSRDGQVQTFDLSYEASGTDIFCLHAGPDQCLYGSSVLPEHLFRFNPQDQELSDLGVCSVSRGEAYSMANLDDKLYIASYPAARISVYDPAQDYCFGETEKANPRDLGRIDKISYRPRSTLAGPLGCIWTASIPDYGQWGGPLSYYNPQTTEKKAYYRIVGDASCYVLAHLAELGLIAVGTSIVGGSGTQPKVEQAGLFLWDYQAEEKVWEGTLERPITAFNALIVGPDRLLYGTLQGGEEAEIFVFDPVAQTFKERTSLPSGKPLDLGMQNGPDGMIYGFTTTGIYRFDPISLLVQEVVRPETGISVAGPIIAAQIYFASGHRLCAVQISELMY